MPDEKPTKAPQTNAGRGAHYHNLKNVKKLPPEEQRKVFDRIRDAIDKELHAPAEPETDKENEKPPE